MTLCNNVNFNLVSVTDIDRGMSGGQFISFISYANAKNNANEKLVVSTDIIKLIANSGIPMLDCEWERKGYRSRGMHPSDQHRNFIKIVLDPNQPACTDLKTHLELAENFFGSDQMKKRLFGTKSDQYIYQPIVRFPGAFDESNSEEDLSSKKYIQPPYCKIKFDSDYNTGEIKTIIKKNGIIIDGVKTVTDICTHLKYGSKLKMTFLYSKIWINKTRIPGQNKYMYGVGLKVQELDIGEYYFNPYPKLQTINLFEIKKAYSTYIRDIKKTVNMDNILEIEI